MEYQIKWSTKNISGIHIIDFLHFVPLLVMFLFCIQLLELPLVSDDCNGTAAADH
jgi:hypothetical protein